ncbi:hypothetical protein Taiwan907_06780 [Helicobacter pylori]
MSKEEAKKYAMNIVKSIPEVLEKGTKGTDHLGRVFVDYGNKRVGLNNEWKKEKLENHWVISSYELHDTQKQAERPTPQAITKEKTFNSLNSVESNHTTKKLSIRNNMNYPNLPNSTLEITAQPEVKEITNELLKQLQSALKSNALFTEQVELSLKGIVRILEVLLSLDFFKNANEIDSSLRNSIEWLESAGESLKAKMKEYESFFNDFNTSMHANEQEVSATLNANT